jgi:hypothetical protein
MCAPHQPLYKKIANQTWVSIHKKLEMPNLYGNNTYKIHLPSTQESPSRYEVSGSNQD